MNVSTDPDPDLLPAVKDSLRRQIAELRKRIQAQQELNLTKDLALRDAFDQAKTKHILKALRLKKQVKDLETTLVDGRKSMNAETKQMEGNYEREKERKVDFLRNQIKDLMDIKRLVAPKPLIYKNLSGRSRYQSRVYYPREETTSQDPETPFFLTEADRTIEQVPTTPESTPQQSPADRLEGFLQDLEGKVSGVHKAVSKHIEELKIELKSLDPGLPDLEEINPTDERSGFSLENDLGNLSKPEIFMDLSHQISTISAFGVVSFDTRTPVDPVEGDFEVTFHWSQGESILDLPPLDDVQEDLEDKNRLAILNSSLVGRPGLQVRGQFNRSGLNNEGDASEPELSMENLSSDPLTHAEDESNKPGSQPKHQSNKPGLETGSQTSNKPRRKRFRCFLCSCFGRSDD